MIRSIKWLKDKFKQGSRPQQADYEDVFDTYLPRVEYERDQKSVQWLKFDIDTEKVVKIEIPNDDVMIPLMIVSDKDGWYYPVDYTLVEATQGTVAISTSIEVGTHCIMIGYILDK